MVVGGETDGEGSLLHTADDRQEQNIHFQNFVSLVVRSLSVPQKHFFFFFFFNRRLLSFLSKMSGRRFASSAPPPYQHSVASPAHKSRRTHDTDSRYRRTASRHSRHSFPLKGSPCIEYRQVHALDNHKSLNYATLAKIYKKSS